MYSTYTMYRDLFSKAHFKFVFSFMQIGCTFREITHFSVRLHACLSVSEASGSPVSDSPVSDRSSEYLLHL